MGNGVRRIDAPQKFVPYTEDELATIVQLYEEGHTAKEIAELTNRTTAAIYQCLHKIRKKGEGATAKPAPPKEQGTRELTPREMIRRLYEMGYRIENNQVVYIEKRIIKIQDIIKNGQTQ